MRHSVVTLDSLSGVYMNAATDFMALPMTFTALMMSTPLPVSHASF